MSDAPADWARARPPSLEDFAAMAEAALRALPEPFKGFVGEV